MKYAFILLITLMLLPNQAKAQTQPSEQGQRCITDQKSYSFGYGQTAQAASEQSCSLWSQVNGVSFESANPTQCFFSVSGQQGSRGMGCDVVAICVTGNGVEPADINGFCPDPETDDEDGDGNSCDFGEEGTADCQCADGSSASPTDTCPENDRDGDGDPDSSDDDDGVCDNDNPDDGDCDGTCGASDEPGSADCEEGQCPVGVMATFQPFDFNQPPYGPTNFICARNECQYGPSSSGNIPCGESTTTPGLHECTYTSNGDSCNGCNEPACTDNSCPDGTTRDLSTGICEEIEDFCEIDEHTNGTTNFQPDGLPDNEGTFACEDNEPCESGDQENCIDFEPVGIYNCGIEELPECTGDPLECAIREESFREHCGTTFEKLGQCEEEFKCTGDGYECAMLRLNRDQVCSLYLTEEQLNSEDSLANFKEGIDDGSSYYGTDGGEGSFIDISNLTAGLDTTGYGFGSQCFQDAEFDFRGETYVIEFSKLCIFLDVIRALLLLLTALQSWRIIAEAF